MLITGATGYVASLIRTPTVRELCKASGRVEPFVERNGVNEGGCSPQASVIAQLKWLVGARVNAGRGSRNVWLGAFGPLGCSVSEVSLVKRLAGLSRRRVSSVASSRAAAMGSRRIC